MIEVIEQHDEGEYTIKNYSDGSSEKFLKSTGEISTSPTPQPTLEDKVNYLYYKSKGVV